LLASHPASPSAFGKGLLPLAGHAKKKDMEEKGPDATLPHRGGLPAPGGKGERGRDSRVRPYRGETAIKQWNRKRKRPFCQVDISEGKNSGKEGG